MERKSNSNFQLPPGFRFHPSDEELIVHYLRNKATSIPLPASIIAEVDLYKCNPWDLPKKALFGEDEWFFFTPRDRKYPNGVRPNRMAASGYWKATGTDKPILTSSGAKTIGVKKALVFYKGRPPKGIKTDWIMNEYRLPETMIWTSKRKGSMRLDDWVLCRVRQKSSIPQSLWEDRYGSSSEAASYFPKADKPCSMNTDPNLEMIKEYLYKECPMLPYIFDSRDLPCMDTDSSISFEGGKTSPSVCEDNSASNHLKHSVLQFDSLYNSRKRKPIEGDQYDSFIQPKKQLSNRDDQNQEAILAENNHNSTTGMNFHGTDQFEGNNFNVDQWNFLIQCQEQGHLPFT